MVTAPACVSVIVVLARPFASVVLDAAPSVPLVVDHAIACPASGAPDAVSSTTIGADTAPIASTCASPDTTASVVGTLVGGVTTGVDSVAVTGVVISADTAEPVLSMLPAVASAAVT